MSEVRIGECEACAPLLASYVDGAAPACDCHRLEQHIQTCTCCRDLVARERAAREALRAHRDDLRACAPEHLKARCAAYAGAWTNRARPAVPLLRPSLIRRWVPLSVAATLLLALAGVFGLGFTNKVQALAIQATVDHVTCSRFSMPQGTADPVAASTGWLERFGWPLHLPRDSGDSGLRLRGVRRCAVTDGRVAHVLYSWKGEPLSVYVLPKRTLGDTATFVSRFHHESVMWSQNDRTYIIVTPRRRDAALDGVIAHVRAAAY